MLIIKPWLLYSKTVENPILKMTEKPNIECIISGFAGTPGYLAPEVIKKNPYGKRVDLWACGEYPNT